MELKHQYQIVAALFCCAMTLAAAVAQSIAPVLHEGFDSGKIDGPVGKAGTRFTMGAEKVFDSSRGTMAFFHQLRSDLKETEWNILGGIRADRDQGYWSMSMLFQIRRQDCMFTALDVGFYAPPMHLPSPFGRWRPEVWRHHAVVWDRYEGIKVYEDGKVVLSNWGSHRWNWTGTPREFSVAGPKDLPANVDEVYLFNVCLTDEQIAQLAKGEAPTGTPLALAPVSERRDYELARMGWDAASLAELPVLESGRTLLVHNARIARCVDAKRPVAYPFRGLLNTTWPSHKYGPSIRGQKLEITMSPGESFDRIRLFTHRHFSARLTRMVEHQPQTMLDIDVPDARFWHRRLDRTYSDAALVLERDFGQLGQIELYRAESLDKAPAVKEAASFALAKADALPDNRQGETMMAQIPHRDWAPVTMAAEPGPAATLTTPAFGSLQAFSAPSETSTFVEGAVIRLVATKLAGPTPVRVELREPVDPEAVWLTGDAVLTPQGEGPQTFTLLLRGRPVANLPSMQQQRYLGNNRYAEEPSPYIGTGHTLVVTVGDGVTWQLGPDGCRVTLIASGQNKALAVDDQVEAMREAYAESMEGHAYWWQRLLLPLVWLSQHAPERMEFRQMWERVDASKPKLLGVDIPPLTMPELKNDTGAPDWAFWQMQAVKRIRNHVHWIIDHKQVWTGEFGGVWNDDSTHVENWMGYMLCLDDSRKIRKAMQRYWEGLWNYQLVEGVGKNTQDAGHYSEEGTSNLGMRLLIEYGDPIAYARTLLPASHVQYWVNPDPAGGYVLKSFWLGPWGAWTEGAFLLNERKGGHHINPLVPLGYLTWYNRHPKAKDYLVGLDIQEQGFMGTARDAAEDWDAALKRYAEEALKPIDRYGATGGGQMRAVEVFGASEEMAKAHGKPFSTLPPLAHYWGSKATDDHWFQWKLTGDIRYLTESFQRICEWFYSHDWLNGPAQPSMDRNPLPRASVIRARLGAMVANRGSSGNMWPLHAISFEKGADDVASLVTTNIDNRLAVRLYAFTDRPHDIQLRTWRCNGRFAVQLAADEDGKPGKQLWQKQVGLTRGSFLDVQVPARTPVLLTVEPLETKPFRFDRPDPAISMNSIELLYGDHLVVNVYNNGSVPVDDVVVRVTDLRSGQLVAGGVQHTGPIEAPLDLRPRFKMVEFKNINCHVWAAVRIELDPDGKIDDLNPFNNVVEFRPRNSFLPEGGWR